GIGYGQLRSPLPARLHHAGDLARRGEVTQHDAAELELAVIAARTPGEFATQPDPHARAVARQLRELQRRVEAILNRQAAVHDNLFERGALRPVARRHAFPLLVAI